MVVENVFKQATEVTPQSPTQHAKSPNPQGEVSPKKPSKLNVRKWSKSRALWTMSMCNCLNGCGLIAGAILAFLLPSGALLPSPSSITLSAYVW